MLMVVLRSFDLVWLQKETSRKKELIILKPTVQWLEWRQ